MIKRKCPHCGEQMEIDSSICPDCGRTSVPSAVSYCFAYLYALIGILAAAAVIAVVYYVFLGNKPLLEETGLGMAVNKIRSEVARPGY